MERHDGGGGPLTSHYQSLVFNISCVCGVHAVCVEFPIKAIFTRPVRIRFSAFESTHKETMCVQCQSLLEEEGSEKKRCTRPVQLSHKTAQICTHFSAHHPNLLNFFSVRSHSSLSFNTQSVFLRHRCSVECHFTESTWKNFELQKFISRELSASVQCPLSSSMTLYHQCHERLAFCLANNCLKVMPK